MSEYYTFDCGCRFNVLDKQDSQFPKIEFSPKLESLNLECSRTWDLISTGNTKGCFQLESRLGQTMSKKLKPENIEQLSGLISILRPGCISGDTKILVGYHKHTDGNLRNTTISIEELFNSRAYDKVISYDENSGKLISNKVLNVIDSGTKECFKIKIKTNERKTNNLTYNWYHLECTDDHKILTPKGWVELKDMKPGMRMLVVRKKNGVRKIKKKITSRFSSKIKIDNIHGIKSYKSKCYENYEYKCIFCDWQNGSLDVNHIEGNRHTNNSVENLSYLCPNHHREYSEGKISNQQIIDNREKYKLFYSPDCKWATFVDKISIGNKKVYDISMSAPHHNFIAGNVVVHNCLEAFREGKSVSNHYIDKKNGLESVDYFHPSLEKCLGSTYGEMIYQEQAMSIAKDLAGFNLQEADALRKAIGKKKPEEMAKIKQKFLEGTDKLKIVTREEAESIFSWIEKSQRYSFNKSHGISYAMNAYLSAYTKAHFPKIFFASYLRYAKDKIDPQQEIKELVRNATEMDILVHIPDLRNLNELFILKNKAIYFGLTDIKGVGKSVYSKILDICKTLDLDNLSWPQTLSGILLNINSTASKALISCGALDYFKKTRTEMLFQYEICSSLSKKELEYFANLSNTYTNKSVKDILSLMLSEKINKNRKAIIQNSILSIEKPPYSLLDKIEWLSDSESSLLGVAITCSRLDSYDISMSNTNCKEFKSSSLSSNIIMAAEISNVSITKTKTGKNPGQEMAFLTLEDQFGMLDSVIFFPEQFTKYKDHLFNGNILVFLGSRSKAKDSFVIEKCLLPVS